MPRFEVTYKVVESDMSTNHAWMTSGPSNYTTVVEAAYQSAAEQMVRNMNGGPNHCHIQRCMFLGE